MSEHDAVHHPKHYTSHPSGYECLDITRDLAFCLGNAVKYCWRSDLKHDSGLEDLRKARFYLNDHVEHGRPTTGREEQAYRKLLSVARADQAHFGAANLRARFFSSVASTLHNAALRHLETWIEIAEEAA